LVFLDHLAITYGSPSGSWYYYEGQVGGPQAVIYLVFQGICQAFFIGLLFLISGYFTPLSYDRKGPKQFLKDRLIRLGIPLVVFIIIIEPIVDYAVVLANGVYHGSFLSYLSTYGFFGFGTLWFVELLLFCALAYVGWKKLSSKPAKTHAIPSTKAILAFALLLGAITFAVRIPFPISYWSPLFNFNYAYFPQYIGLFVVGLIAVKGKWFTNMPKDAAHFWRRIGSAALLLMLIAFVISASSAGGINLIFGGFTWQSAAYAFGEQLFCVAVCISLTIWFRERVNFQNRFTKALSDSSFAAYIIQVPVLVFLALSLQSIQLPLLLKFAIVSPIGVSLCFGFAYLIKKIPKVNKVL